MYEKVMRLGSLRDRFLIEQDPEKVYARSSPIRKVYSMRRMTTCSYEC